LNKDQFWQTLKTEHGYQSPHRRNLAARYLPGWATVVYYLHLIGTFTTASREAKRGELDNERWAFYAHKVIRDAESVGGRIHISGLEHIAHQKSPLVYIANHMSLFETLALAGITLAFSRVNFVIKEELRQYPIIGNVMRALNLIAVSRSNPRQDLRVVMQAGKEFISNGGSIIIFPQATRSAVFDIDEFNSLGVKLASKAGVPVVPLAVKTDFHGNGKWFKDVGRIDPRKSIYFKFGEPIPVEGNTRRAHQQVVGFIVENLSSWGMTVRGLEEFMKRTVDSDKQAG